MSVTVNDIISLKFFKDIKILSGREGLNNIIKRVNFSDCPIIGDEIDAELILKGDLFINSLYLFESDYTKIYEALEYYISNGSAGLLITDEYIDKLPAKVLELSNTKNYPILLIPKELPYAEIINKVMGMILLDQSHVITEMKIDRLLDKSIGTEETIETARTLNGRFKENYLTIFASCVSKFENSGFSLVTAVNSKENIELCSYKKDYLFIINFNDLKERSEATQFIKDLLYSYDKNYKLGISEAFSDIKNFSTCLKQSKSSIDMSDIMAEKVVFYSNLRLYKMLYPIKDSIYAREYYDEIIAPIKDLDKASGSELYETLCIFLDSDLDYKKTSEKLYQHENTIRYRINKIKKMLDLEHEVTKFIEQVSIGIKIDKLISNT